MTVPNEPMTTFAGMSDGELKALVAAGQAELAAREKRRREDAIAKIRALAGEAGLAVSIDGARGRPARKRSSSRAGEAAGAS